MARETPTTEPRLATDQHDAVLAVALGALSIAQRVEQQLARPGSGQPLERDDPVVLAAMGALSLGRTLRRWLEEAAQDIPERVEPPAATPLPRLRELLR